mgnify:CR=1 FL=1|jgi:Fe(3+) dicitrate transport protein
MCKKLAFAFLMLSFPLSGFAQESTGSIVGSVVDAENGFFLSNVHVVIEALGEGRTTNKNGVFSFLSLPAGRYSIQFTSVGYEVLNVVSEVPSGKTISLKLELEAKAIELPEVLVERESILGGSGHRIDPAASSHRISTRQLEKFQYSDASRALRSIPGINIQEEDGFGLRPNIGIRGTGSERSSKISMMEDGVLTAPAPYAAPAAYYFPTIGRMSEIEVRKGSSQIKYGPYTTGGAINFLSTPLPDRKEVELKLTGGSNDARIAHLKLGNAFKNGAFIVESFQSKSSGFKHLDFGGPTGFNKRDYMAKLRLNTGPNAGHYQAVLIKVLHTNEVSNETYLGLTSSDFSIDPFRRYASSALDEMNATFTQLTIRHLIQLSASTQITSTVYRSEFSRNWYKLDSVAPSGAKSVSITSFLSDPITNSDAYRAASSKNSVTGDRLSVKANNRDYTSKGFQTELSSDLLLFSAEHKIEIGLRIHGDEMDRFQWVDKFFLLNGEMTRSEQGVPGTDSNRIESARAVALFFLDNIGLGRLTLNPGLRFENITLSRKDYGKSDPSRSGLSVSKNDNTVNVWIPGISASFKSTDFLTVFAGAHKGFAPPGSREGTKPESSMNIETGVRLNNHAFRADITLFNNEYQNLLGSDLASSGGTGSGDQFNGGAATVRGLEAAVSHNFGGSMGWKVSLPISFTYTLTDARFKTSFESGFEGWGSVQSGFQLPYVSKHVVSLQAGIEGNRLDLDVDVSFTSPMRTIAGNGPILDSESTQKHTVIDLGGSFEVSSKMKLFMGIRNIANVTYVAARRPAGLRPGLPRTVILGMNVKL